MPIRASKFAWHGVTFEEDFMSAALNAACAKVGRYLYEFAIGARYQHEHHADIVFIKANVLENTAVEVDDAVLGRQVEGLREIGFNPHATKGFPSQVRA
ncbi:hypothetical protein ACVWWI_006294 [Bradyrhizobium sp. USDA 3686]|uniref:hypothetical protein n=1 Tax=Bradyrhizobium canariense TaxID=255045 RepID=UPI0019594B0F|nr:hypothetical protein [Bradyrhizobium canariense]MBM7488154.1 hypothetical protein [Bradyrhizobium canariense]